jgi:hypothetical protein
MPVLILPESSSLTGTNPTNCRLFISPLFRRLALQNNQGVTEIELHPDYLFMETKQDVPTLLFTLAQNPQQNSGAHKNVQKFSPNVGMDAGFNHDFVGLIWCRHYGGSGVGQCLAIIPLFSMVFA